jgi:hypothetical protein
MHSLAPAIFVGARAIEGRLAIGLVLHPLDAGLLLLIAAGWRLVCSIDEVDCLTEMSDQLRLALTWCFAIGNSPEQFGKSLPGELISIVASMERATIFVGRITKSLKIVGQGNEQGVNHHENVDARRLFGGSMRGHARLVCAASAGNAGRRCPARGKDTGCPEIGARQSGRRIS